MPYSVKRWEWQLIGQWWKSESDISPIAFVLSQSILGLCGTKDILVLWGKYQASQILHVFERVVACTRSQHFLAKTLTNRILGGKPRDLKNTVDKFSKTIFKLDLFILLQTQSPPYWTSHVQQEFINIISNLICVDKLYKFHSCKVFVLSSSQSSHVVLRSIQCCVRKWFST